MVTVSFLLTFFHFPSDGLLTITDMDTIEVSNLSRQFLFRSNHVGKYKAGIAGAQVAKMNPDIKTDTLQLMVAQSTEGLSPLRSVT